MPVYTIGYDVEQKASGSWAAIADSAIRSVETTGETSGSEDNPAGFGDQAIQHATITMLRSAATFALPRTPVRITFTRTATSAKSFTGFVQSYGGDLDTVRLECQSVIEDLPNRTKNLYSPLYYRRPPATKTTASSVEDPAGGGYAAGLINWILWQAGGRPYEQAGSYPTADFYYSLEQAIRAPDWSWIAGEDGWSECLRLARAVGGQLYQGADGVIYYKQPLTMIGTAAYTFTSSVYADIEEEGRTGEYAATITCSYTPRFLYPTQEVINDTTYRVVEAGASLTIDLEPRWPLYSVVLDGGTLKDKNIIATFFDGQLASYHATTGFTVVTTVYAMRITIVVTNNSSRNMQISKITILGVPVAAGETGTVTVGSGKPTKQLEDNIFVQNGAHAKALASMALSFYGAARTIRAVKDCPYDPDRVVGETVGLTASQLSLSGAAHVITRIETGDTGARATYQMLDVTGLPALADYWLVKSTAQSGTKKVAW